MSLKRYELSVVARVVRPSFISLKVAVPRACASTIRSFTVNPREVTVNVSSASADIPVTTLSSLSSNL